MSLIVMAREQKDFVKNLQINKIVALRGNLNEKSLIILTTNKNFDSWRKMQKQIMNC